MNRKKNIINLNFEQENRDKEEGNGLAKSLSAGSSANFGDNLNGLHEEMRRIENLSLSMNRRKQYKDAAEAAQEAFLSAAYAAAAARAAVELSRSISSRPPDNLNMSNYDQKKQVFRTNNEERSEAKARWRKYSWEDSVSGQDTVSHLDSDSLNSDEDREETRQIDEMLNIEKVYPRSNSLGAAWGVHEENEQYLKFDESNDKGKREKVNAIGNKNECTERGTRLLYYSHNRITTGLEANPSENSEEQISTGLAAQSLQNTVRRPISVRTRR